MRDELAFVHISDTHIGATEDYTHRGFAPYSRTARLLEEIRRLTIDFDFLIHTGDVCGDKDHHATADHYRLARKQFDTLTTPAYYLVGNHDSPKDLRTGLSFGTHRLLSDGDEELYYEFTARNFLCIALHSSIPTQRQGLISSKQLRALRERLAGSTQRCLIFLHHPPITVGSPWMDENMLLKNGSDLHTLLTHFRDRIVGVFFGHIHQPLQIVKDGISYFSSPGTIFQFSTLPSDTSSNLEPESVVGFYVVRLRDGQLQVNTRLVHQTQMASS